MALPLALGVLAVCSATAMAVVSFSTSNSRNAALDRGALVAQQLAEAGVNNAMAVLSNPANNAMNGGLLPPRTNAYAGGSVTYSGTLDTIAALWTITAKGTANGRLTGGAIRTRTLTAKVPVYPTYSQPLNNPAWNYVFSRGGPSAGCDTVLANSINISSPFYVEGNLCLQNTARISAGPLMVHGWVNMTQSANAIGASGAPVGEVRIKNGCQWKNNPFHNPCQLGDGNAGFDNIWAGTFRTDPPPVVAPVPLWDDWYLNASPGPYYPCTTQSGAVPLFDNDQGTTPSIARRNNSLAAVADLTPAGSYTCKTTTGELSWDAATKTLTANGTIFVDGSAKVDNGALNRYQGYATIYLSGTLLIKNSKLCALVSGSACTTSGWDPNARMLVFVANGAGGQVPADTSVQLVSAAFQGALYATRAIDVGTTSVSEGPLDGAPVKLGQTSGSAFPPFTLVPAGMPGNPAVYAQPGTPSFGG